MMTVDTFKKEDPLCSECQKTDPTYMLRIVGDIGRVNTPESNQRTKYACKRHLTTLIDAHKGSVVVRKMGEA